MSPKASPTDARTVALYFLDHTTDGRNTGAVIAKNVNMAKNLLNVGYTVEEIIATIDHVVKSGVRMYSFGYLNHCIADVLAQINKDKVDENVAKAKQEMEEFSRQAMKEVVSSDESTERNRKKAERASLQSGFGKKFNFDMFEGHGQDT